MYEYMELAVRNLNKNLGIVQQVHNKAMKHQMCQ